MFQSLNCLICNPPGISGMMKGTFLAPHLHYKVLISFILDFRRHFLLCISSLISSHLLSKVFWKFQNLPPLHSDAYNFGMDKLCQMKCRYDFIYKRYFLVQICKSNDNLLLFFKQLKIHKMQNSKMQVELYAIFFLCTT